ncbi:type IV secretory system conjugative DNA transfer family protein [Nocardia sp. NPDC088792]|uniref:type IV secretory system conjugative DNA transfer family protein n=1 Tax=Nocardia sp. NPDC088792 TaxID=3364332 RepID=UPI003824E081
MTEAGVRERADALGVRLGPEDMPGVSIGSTVRGKRLFGAYDDLHLDIWGPRQGKSTCRAIPAIVQAIGPVITTSTTRDLVDATRDVREAKGSPTWMFDPHGVSGESPCWYWDPLAWIGRSEVRAARLAAHFADADIRSDSRDFFEIQAEELLAGLFLAAAAGGFPITEVWQWVTNPLDTEPIEVLRRDGLDMIASGIAAMYNADIRQQRGIFATAQKMCRCLRYSDMHPWITAGGGRVPFDELEFLERSGTLYVLSDEGHPSTTPLVSALIDAVLDVAVHRAARQPVPVLAVVDDAAAVVRWRAFPGQCVRYGSHAIVVMIMLQSWAQGVRCWGQDGMDELWSAATVKVVGGGIDDVQFLRDRVEGIGHRLGVHELRSLRRGRALLLAAGVPARVIVTVPWWTGEYADAVRASIAAHSPNVVRLTEPLDLIDVSPPAVAPHAEGPDGPDEIRPL